MITYVDTSVIVKLLVDEPESEHAAVIWTSADALATCWLTHVEARAALAAAYRAKRISADALSEAEGGLGVLWAQLNVVNVDELLVRRAGDLASEHGLRGYDAVHLAAAMHVGARVMLVSDGRLARAARDRGLVLAVPSRPAAVDVVHLDGPGVQVVHEWLAAVLDRRDLAAAWTLTDPEFRLALVQSWICAGAAGHIDDIEATAQALASPQQPAHRLWQEFATWRVGRWRESFPDYVVDVARRGTVSTPYLFGVDLEAVMIAAADDAAAPARKGRTIEVQRFTVRHADGTVLVAGIGAALPVPGWPPTETPLPPLRATPDDG